MHYCIFRSDTDPSLGPGAAGHPGTRFRAEGFWKQTIKEIQYHSTSSREMEHSSRLQTGERCPGYCLLSVIVLWEELVCVSECSSKLCCVCVCAWSACIYPCSTGGRGLRQKAAHPVALMLDLCIFKHVVSFEDMRRHMPADNNLKPN